MPSCAACGKAILISADWGLKTQDLTVNSVRAQEDYIEPKKAIQSS